MAVQQTPPAAAEPQDLAGTGLASPLTVPPLLPGGPSQLVGVEEGVQCGAAKQVWRLAVLHTLPLSLLFVASVLSLHTPCTSCLRANRRGLL